MEPKTLVKEAEIYKLYAFIPILSVVYNYVLCMTVCMYLATNNKYV